jgi:integrase
MAEIKRRGREKWFVRVFLGRNDAGKAECLTRIIHGNRKDAESWARDRERERDLGGPTALKALDLTLNALFDDLVRDYMMHGKSTEWCQQKVNKHLRPYFGKISVNKLTSDSIKTFILVRQGSGAKNATINRELALLRRSLNLALQSDPPKIARAIRVPELEENNVRRGFFEDHEYRALLRELPEHAKGILVFGYYTGCRRGEILGLKWDQVDLAEGVVRLWAGETKNDEARIIPLAEEVIEYLKLQRARHDRDFPNSPWVFPRGDGERMHDIRGSWTSACFRAGLWEGDEKTGRPTRLLHDLRRTGVRNLVRAGTPEKVAQTISGHKTRAVFERYNIVSESDLKDAARRLQDYLRVKREAEQGSSSRTIVAPEPQGKSERVN